MEQSFFDDCAAVDELALRRWTASLTETVSLDIETPPEGTWQSIDRATNPFWQSQWVYNQTVSDNIDRMYFMGNQLYANPPFGQVESKQKQVIEEWERVSEGL